MWFTTKVNEFTLKATVFKTNLLQFINMITIVINVILSWKSTYMPLNSFAR